MHWNSEVSKAHASFALHDIVSIAHAVLYMLAYNYRSVYGSVTLSCIELKHAQCGNRA